MCKILKDKYSKIKNSNIAKYEIQISGILSSFQLPKWRSPGEGWLENPSPTDCPGMRLEIITVLQIYLEIPTLFFFSRMKLLFKQLKVKFCETTSVLLFVHGRRQIQACWSCHISQKMEVKNVIS